PVHDEPPSSVRKTRHWPPTVHRRSSESRGITYAVFGRRGWATTGKPKSDGSPALISVHFRPKSPLRNTPPWCCRKRRSGPAVSGGNLMFPASGSVHVPPRSSLLRTTDPQCSLVAPASSRVTPPRLSMPTE